MQAAVMTQDGVAQTCFTTEVQEVFAEVSGDFNPLHMDPVAARRMASGRCVVHGVQSLLWALEHLAAGRAFDRLCAIDADFAQFLYLDEVVTLAVVKNTGDEVRGELRAGGVRVSQFALRFGPRPVTGAGDPPASGAIHYGPEERQPLPLGWDEVASAFGTVAPVAAGAALAVLYPRLLAAFGEGRVAALLALTRLVGMVSPGLHSTFHRIGVRLVEDAAPVELLSFSTISSDPRFGLVSLGVRGAGLAGRIKASWRQPPTRQPSAEALRPLVERDRFRGQTALVVGGSRGIGEVTAKLLAMGGAHTIITYASGAADAAAVAADIRAAGGMIETIPFDARLPAGPQLGGLTAVPHSLYFFATPRISGRAAADVSPELLRQFNGFYVDAFHDLCVALRPDEGPALQVFYPSTIFVTEPEKSLAEYAMAKAAGEVLAAYMTRFTPGIEVHTVRLPRLLTDQTVSLLGTPADSVAAAMVPIVEAVQARAARVTPSVTPSVTPGDRATRSP